MDPGAPPGLSPGHFTTPPQHHLDPYARFPPVRGTARPPEPSFPAHLHPNLQALDPNDAFSAQFDPQLADVPYGQPYGLSHLYATSSAPLQATQQHERVQELPSHPAPSQHEPPLKSGGQFGILAPQSQVGSPGFMHHEAIQQLRQEQGLLDVNGSADGETRQEAPPPKQGGHFPGMKAISNPPDLEAWRQKLFDVDRPITLTEEDFQTYFPHVDNVYSHRSTQRYKRQPFVSHYWDCRLKGRPPGTPKSEDPTKRKRKRQARERDLCDVKIKITEFFEGARQILGTQADNEDTQTEDFSATNPAIFGLSPDGSTPSSLPGTDGARYYTIQRVNGNGGNGKGDGVAGPHKHTLAESDSIKKNSIQRIFAKEAKQKKKTEKSYHRKATGAALATVKKHSREETLKLYGSCFCPFVQRVWISLELKGVPYQYYEIDPYHKTQEFLAINPRGLIPALRHDDWNCYESSVLMEYLEDSYPDQHPLLPHDAKGRAHSRLWSDHVNRKLIPSFYHILKAQDASEQVQEAEVMQKHLQELIDAADAQGPFFLGSRISFVDVQLVPWMLRMRRVLKPYRGWPDPVPGSRWARWVEALEADEAVKRTTSTDELYKDSYERYAENRPGTSQVADAVNQGRGLP